MRRHWMLHGVKFAFFAAVFLALVSFVVMTLWNWLIPAIFGWHAIGFWEAAGLLVLGRILFGGFHGHAGRHWHWRHRMRERWAQMTPEQREKFREGMRSHCGWHCRTESEPKAPAA